MSITIPTPATGKGWAAFFSTLAVAGLLVAETVDAKNDSAGYNKEGGYLEYFDELGWQIKDQIWPSGIQAGQPPEIPVLRHLGLKF